MMPTVRDKLVILVLGSTLTACASRQPEIDETISPPTIPGDVANIARNDGAIYAAHSNRFFFEDIRARRIGDIINVELDERTDATKSATTSANKGTGINLPSPTLFGGGVSVSGRNLLENQVSTSTDFSGAADSSQSNRLSGSIAVMVHEVLPNGNLLIKGQKVLTLNQGSETVRLSGVVRPADITPQNTVNSNQIADANITYGGSGILADSNRAGWMTRLLTGKLWPF